MRTFSKNGRWYVLKIKNVHEKRSVLKFAFLNFKKRRKNAPEHQSNKAPKHQQFLKIKKTHEISWSVLLKMRAAVLQDTMSIAVAGFGNSVSWVGGGR